MKTIILCENQVNTLLEYAGYADKFEAVTEYIFNIFKRTIYFNMKWNGFNENQFDEYIKAFENNELRFPLNDKIEIPTEKFDLGFTNLKSIFIIPYLGLGGSFIPSKSIYNYKYKYFSSISISLGIQYCDNNDLKLKSAIQHELTHAYEYMNRIIQNGYYKTMDEFNKKYYVNPSKSKNIIDDLSYALSRTEINALISELWTYFLETKSDYFDMDWKKTKIGKRYKNIEFLKYLFSNDIKYSKEVMDFVENNPQYKGMFPSVRNHNPNAYQRRIINMLDYQLNYIEKKVNRLIRRYRKELRNNNLNYNGYEDI